MFRRNIMYKARFKPRHQYRYCCDTIEYLIDTTDEEAAISRAKQAFDDVTGNYRYHQEPNTELMEVLTCEK
jgi:hypothetical protein